jgi:hypothetical protein
MPGTDFPVEIPRDRKMELGLMFSHTCNITCRHCGILSSPQNKNKMRLEDARRWIMDAARIPIIKHINFTGGEPFLFQDEHAELFALCRSLGLGTRVVTNGFWARTVNDGLKVLSRMKEAGLTELNFSADIFHLEFLAPETLRNALECARQLDYCRIVSFVTNSHKDPLDHFSTLYGIPRADVTELIPTKIMPLLMNPETAVAVKARILVYAGGVIGLGRAANYPGDLLWSHVDQLSDGCCLEVVNKPVIYPDGDLQACCCAGGKMSPFTIGNLHRETLEGVIGKMFGRSQFHFINTNGPKALFKLVAAVRPDLPKQNHYTSVCEMCVRTADGLSADELDTIANYGHLKGMFNLFGADLAEPAPSGSRDPDLFLTSRTLKS